MKRIFEIKDFLERNGQLSGHQERDCDFYHMHITGILNDNDTIFFDKIVPIYEHATGVPWALSRVFVAQEGTHNPFFFEMLKHVPHIIFYVKDIGYTLHILGLYIKE